MQWHKSVQSSCSNLLNKPSILFSMLSGEQLNTSSEIVSPNCCSNVKNPPWKLTKTSNQGLEILALWWWGWELTRNHKQAQEVWQPNLFFNSITALMFLATSIWSTKEKVVFLQTKIRFCACFSGIFITQNWFYRCLKNTSLKNFEG